MVRELGGGRGGRSGGRSIGGLARQKHADALVFDHVHVLVFAEEVVDIVILVLFIGGMVVAERSIVVVVFVGDGRAVSRIMGRHECAGERRHGC